MRPCLYGGDMVALGGVTPEHVDYNELPWKFAAGTPNILGTIVSAQALRLLIDLALTPDEPRRFRQAGRSSRDEIRDGMNRIADYTRTLAERAIESLAQNTRTAHLRSAGSRAVEPRSSRSTSQGWDPMALADALSRQASSPGRAVIARRSRTAFST